MNGERLTRALVLSAFVVVIVGVCPGRSHAQEAILTDNSTILASRPKYVPGPVSQRSLQVVGPLDTHAERDALLKFDLSTLPAGTASTNILKATLILYVNTLTRNGTFDIASLGGPWNEQTVTWATAPALIQVEASGVVPVEDQFVSVDLTPLVKNWLDGTITNNGIAIIPNASGVDASFDSKESTTTSHQPQLLIATSQNVSLFPNDIGYVTATVTNAVAQTNGTYSGMSAGSATFASNSASLGNLSTSGWSNFVTSVTNGLPDGTTLAGKAATNQNISLFPNDANYVTKAVTNGLPDANTLAGKASTNLFSGSNTGLVFHVGPPDPTKFLREDGTWAPAGGTNGFVYMSDLWATNDALRIGPLAVTNGLPDTYALAGKAATNQNVSLFPNDANYVTKAVTNGLPDTYALAGKAATNQNISLFPNDANYVTKAVTNGLPDTYALAGKAATNQNVSLFSNDIGYVTATVTNAVAQTNGTYSGMSAGSATFASNSANLGNLSTSGWSNFVTSVTNGLPNANTLAGKASTNIFSGSNTGLVANAGAPDTTKFLREDGTWAPAGATNGFAYLSDLNATNDAIRTGSQAVTNGLETISAAGALASTGLLTSTSNMLFGVIGSTNALLVTQIMNASNTLFTVIGSTNASLVAQIANASNMLLGVIGSTNASLVTQITSASNTLFTAIGSTNASLVTQITNVSNTLFTAIGSTNALLVTRIINTSNTLAAATTAVTNGLPDANTLAGKASTNIFSGSNTGLVANAGAPDTTKFLRQDGSWTAPAGATNGFAYVSDLNATNNAIRIGSQSVTNGLPDAYVLAGKAATNQIISLFSNDAGYVTISVTNSVAQTNGTYLGMSVGTATFASNSGSLGNLPTSGWSNFVSSITNGLPDVNTLAGKAATNQYVSLFPNDVGYVTMSVTNGLPDANALADKAATNQNISLFPNDAGYVTLAVTNGLPDVNTLAGKASTNIFSGSNTGLVANAGAPDPTKFLRQDGSWTAPAGATNGLAFLNDLNATNDAIRTGPQAVTNGLPDANTLAGVAPTNQNISLFPNDAGYVTLAVTNGLPDVNALAGKAATNQNVSLFPNDAGYVTVAVTNGLETIAAANQFAPTNTAPCALTNATITLGMNFTNGNFRCFYSVSVGMVSTTVVDFINLTDGTTNTISVADVGGLILTNSVFQFAGPNEVFVINTNRSGAGQAPSLISVMGKMQ